MPGIDSFLAASLRARARSVIGVTARAWGLAVPPAPRVLDLPALSFAFAF